MLSVLTPRSRTGSLLDEVQPLSARRALCSRDLCLEQMFEQQASDAYTARPFASPRFFAAGRMSARLDSVPATDEDAGISNGKGWKLGCVALVLTIAAVLCVFPMVVFKSTPILSLARTLGNPALVADSKKHYLICAEVARNVEYHTSLSLRRVPNIFTEDMCCAACSADPNCKVWSWGERQFVSGMSNSCYLKHLLPGEAPTIVARPGVVSGILLHRLDKHGIVAKTLAEVKDRFNTVSALVDRKNLVDRHNTCRGGLDWTGYGRVQLVNAQRFTPGLKSTMVDIPSNSFQVEPHLRSRAFFTENTCNAGEYDANQFLNLKLLGHTIHYTVDMSDAGCGCNAQLMLVPMRRDYRKLSKCGDYFCGPAQKHVCGQTCHAIRLQDANQYAWSTSVQLQNDEHGISVGFGGGLKEDGRREWNQMEYGTGGSCIDTSFPFEVDISFRAADVGVLESLTVMLWQPGHHCNLTARIDKYTFRGKNGFEELGAMLEEGVTPVVSYWSSPHMAWLDGLGSDAAGPCAEDAPQACPKSVRFYDFATRWSAKHPPRPSAVFDEALIALNKDVEQRAELTKEAERASLLPCTGSCSEYLDPDLIDSQGAEKSRPERKVANTEWEVVFDILPVRRTPHYNGIVIRHKRKGQVVIGERTGDWVRLLREPGWVAIKKVQKKTITFLVPRSVGYTKLTGGTCETAGMFPIDGKENCQAAAFAIGYMDTFVNSFDNVTSRPYGCYLIKGQLFFVSNPANKGNDVGTRHMICSTRAYPTTTVTTTVGPGGKLVQETTKTTLTTTMKSMTTTTTGTSTMTNTPASSTTTATSTTTALSTTTATSTTTAPSTTTATFTTRAPSTTTATFTTRAPSTTTTPFTTIATSTTIAPPTLAAKAMTATPSTVKTRVPTTPPAFTAAPSTSVPSTTKPVTTVKVSSSAATSVVTNNNGFGGFPDIFQLPSQLQAAANFTRNAVDKALSGGASQALTAATNPTVAPDTGGRSPPTHRRVDATTTTLRPVAPEEQVLR